MNKIEYAKFQFMILVLRSLAALVLTVILKNPPGDSFAITLSTDLVDHTNQIKELMEEK